MHLSGQVRGQHIGRQREVVALGMPDALAPAAAYRGKPSFLPGPRVLPADRVDVGARGEHRAEERHLRLRRRCRMHKSRWRVEEPGLDRTWRRGFAPGQFKQPQQSAVFCPQLCKLRGQRGQMVIVGVTPTHVDHGTAWPGSLVPHAEGTPGKRQTRHSAYRWRKRLVRQRPRQEDWPGGRGLAAGRADWRCDR